MEDTLKADVVWQVERDMLPADRIFRETSSWSHHLMEAGHTIALFEFPYIGANAMDDPGDIVATIAIVVGKEFGDFPVLGVAAGDYDLNDDLVGFRLWDLHILYSEIEAFANQCFFHDRRLDTRCSDVNCPALAIVVVAVGLDTNLLIAIQALYTYYSTPYVESHIWPSNAALLGNDHSGVSSVEQLRMW